MIFRLRNALFLFAFLISGLFSWYMYTYFFDKTVPSIMVHGIENGEYYAGDIFCKLKSNKTGNVSLYLDNKPLNGRFKIGKNDECIFTIPTKTITPGEHHLLIEFVDTNYHKNNIRLERAFFVDNTPLQAALINNEGDYKVFQGRTLHVQFQVNKEIKTAQFITLSNAYSCFPETKGSLVYECFVPIACEEQPNEYQMKIEVTDKVGNKVGLEGKFQVVAYPFKNVTLFINPEKIKEEEALGPDGQKLEEEIAELTKQSIKEKLWRGSFCKPIDIIQVTGEFGTIRTTQHRGRYTHKALDIINTPKSVVWATQDGIIAMKKRFALSGNTVIIDHGWGVLSLFYHLDDFAPHINVGSKISKGNPIGYIGKTGYAKGYHLHWEMRINNIAIDPLQWTNPTF